MDMREIGPNGQDTEIMLRRFSADGDAPVVELPVAELVLAESPRSKGISSSHVHILKETDATLPPILVHHSSMRVIDGMHRVQVAILKGMQRIQARLFEGSHDEAYLLAIKMNTAHGLPLQLADRRLAASQIIKMHPEWSNRAIAEVASLSDKTVAKLRSQTSSESEKRKHRIGKDGKCRPVNLNDGRLRASQTITAHPDASLREIAKAAGISPNTARKVRNSLQKGQSPLLEAVPTSADSLDMAGIRGRFSRPLSKTISSIPVVGGGTTWVQLKSDPSIRSTEVGRFLLRSLSLNAINADTWDKIIEAIPRHCVKGVADAARECAAAWQQLADRLDNTED
ncbi:hypothetical protein [Streptomyces sp. NPDC002067]